MCQKTEFFLKQKRGGKKGNEFKCKASTQHETRRTTPQCLNASMPQSTHISVSTLNTFFIIIFIDEYAYTSLYSIHTCGLHTCGFTTSNGTLETCGSFLTPPCRILDLCPFTILVLSIQSKKFLCRILATISTRQGTVFLHSDYILASLCRPGFVDPLA